MKYKAHYIDPRTGQSTTKNCGHFYYSFEDAYFFRFTPQEGNGAACDEVIIMSPKINIRKGMFITTISAAGFQHVQNQYIPAKAEIIISEN